MRNFCFEECDTVLKELGARREGLSDAEAEIRLKKFGKNELQKGKSGGIIRLFFSQFADFMTALLIAAAIISGGIAFITGDKGDLTDTIIILCIIFLNAAVGTVQQFRADRAIENLKKLSANECTVRRGGAVKKIPCETLTIGDIVLLEEGDVVPADIRLLECNNLKCDESAITGESVGVEKSPERIHGNSVTIGSASNSLFGSSFVVGGSGSGVVTAVGMGTEMGKIALMLKEEKPAPTPLEKSLGKLGKIITAAVLLISAAIFFLGVFIRQDGVLKNFMTAVAVAVAAIPEGLPAVVTVIMAMGVQKMSKKNVIIRKLRSVETLGGCTVICTDKTGTLTQNRLKVARLFLPYSPSGTPQTGDKILYCMAACNAVKGERGKYVGDPTETALKNYADAFGEYGYLKTGEIPFSSDRKMMTVSSDCGGEKLIFCKGAPDYLIKKCAYIQTEKGVRALTDSDERAILSSNDEMSGEALRVLALAYKEGTALSEDGLIFLGLAGLRDGLKAGVENAVKECKAAHIKVVMITGDHLKTALAVAKKAGIAANEREAITGEEIDGLKGEEKEKRICACTVFARVSPRHKNLIIKCLKKQGEVVAMTGDGVNDAPSVKSADIGVAMGVSGADVTKSASDMIIADDNFATIVSAVREGRRISSNVKKTIRFFLSTNLAEVLAIFIACIAFFRYEFLASTQLLWLNLITDSFPVLALGAEREDGDVMIKPPEPASSLFSRRSAADMTAGGIYITAITVFVFALSLSLWGNAVATTAAFLTISFAELFHAFNIRSERRSAFCGFFSNKILIFTVLAGVILNVLLVITPLGAAFSLSKLNAVQWILIFSCSLSVIAFFEAYKLILRRIKR